MYVDRYRYINYVHMHINYVCIYRDILTLSVYINYVCIYINCVCRDRLDR